MTSISSGGLTSLSEPVPFSLDEWRTILNNWTSKPRFRLSTPPESRHQTNQSRKHDKGSLPKNRVFGDSLMESFLVSPSTNSLQTSIGFPRTDLSKVIGFGGKRNAPTNKTIINPTTNKTAQKFHDMNENMLILKLSKNRQTKPSVKLPSINKSNSSMESFESTDGTFLVPNKQSTYSTASIFSTKSLQTMAESSDQYSFPSHFSSMLKVEGQKHCAHHHDTFVNPPGQIEPLLNSIPNNSISLSTANQSMNNSSLLSFRPTALTTNSSSNRPRIVSETVTNGLFISSDKYKSPTSNSSRQTRTSLTNSTMPSIFLSTQPLQKSTQPTSKSRTQTEKSTTSKENFDYPDPFTNCPVEIMNRLAQLSKLQAETVEWEKKKRFTKRKPTTQFTPQGKDSP